MKNMTREIGSKAWVSGGQETIDIPKDYALVDLMIELYAIVNIASASAGTGVLMDNSPAQLVKNIEIRANGRDVLKSLDLEGLVRLTQIRYGTACNNTVLANANDQTNTACYVYAILPFAMWRSVVPFDTVYNTRQLTSLQAIFTFGASTDLFSTQPGSGVITIQSGTTVYLSSREACGIADDKVFLINKESTNEATPTATASEYPIDLCYAKGLRYRQIALRTKIDSVLSNSLLNNLKLMAGGVVIFNLGARRIRNRNKLIYGLETWPTGWYAIDFCEDGRLVDTLDTANLSSLQLICDITVSGTTDKIKVYTTELIEPIVAK